MKCCPRLRNRGNADWNHKNKPFILIRLPDNVKSYGKNGEHQQHLHTADGNVIGASKFPIQWNPAVQQFHSNPGSWWLNNPDSSNLWFCHRSTHSSGKRKDWSGIFHSLVPELTHMASTHGSLPFTSDEALLSWRRAGR